MSIHPSNVLDVTELAGYRAEHTNGTTIISYGYREPGDIAWRGYALIRDTISGATVNASSTPLACPQAAAQTARKLLEGEEPT